VDLDLPYKILLKWHGNRLKASGGLVDLDLPHIGGCIGGGGGLRDRQPRKKPRLGEALKPLFFARPLKTCFQGLRARLLVVQSSADDPGQGL